MQRAGRMSVARRGLVDLNPEMFEYVANILNSRVYDTCIETPLQPMPKLSGSSNGRSRGPSIAEIDLRVEHAAT